MTKAKNNPVDENGKLIPMKQADPVLKAFSHAIVKDDSGNLFHGPLKVFRDGTAQMEIKEITEGNDGEEKEEVKGVAFAAGYYSIQSGE